MDILKSPDQIARVVVCLFFAVLFLQSGIDKVVDRKGNLDWLTPHFQKSPFNGVVPVLLGVLTLFEVASGLLALIAVFTLLASGDRTLATAALGLSAITLVMLFTGQRLAKDYAGAVTIASYFAVALIGLWLMTATHFTA